MPTVGVPRDDLFARLGKVYTQEEFELLCFEFGIELDDVTSEREMVAKEQGEAKSEDLDDTVIYKIDIPANRYDLLCIEGIARSLRIFKGLQPAPSYRLVEPKKRLTMNVKPSTIEIRPFVVCAVLRGMKFDDKIYKSFIDLQDKLHQNICRGRKLVAIGTHDLGTVEGPFTYSAEKPQDIKFIPLTEETQEFNSGDLLQHYATNPGCKHLAPYVPLIVDSSVYPVIRDAKGRVLSLPPIINSRHSRITLDTKDVFIECTATDLTKAHIVLDTMVTMFSEYCSTPFSIEPVDVVYEEGSMGVKHFGSESAFVSHETTPRLSARRAEAKVNEINSIIGVEIDPERICELCTKMQLGPAEINKEGTKVLVTVPPTRSDVLHPVDIAEDVAIAYGFNNLIPGNLPKTLSVGGPLPLNHFSDQMRDEISRAGYMEVLTHGLCRTAENFEHLRRPNIGNAVQLANPANEEYEVLRTSLLPGILKTLNHNKSMPKKNGIKFFEISDVVVKDDQSDVGARNERHLCAAFSGMSAGFEVIHGLVDRIMTLNQVKQVSPNSVPEKGVSSFSIIPCENPHICETFFKGRRASVLLSINGNDFIEIGCFGVLHPEVLAKDKYDMEFPCSAVELNLEPFI
jgi:phenylalanyl-tRNA synthetase beta chain